MSDPKPAVSFIGLGAMGWGMATHLISAGYPIVGYDVYGPTLTKFAAAGGQTATSPAAAVKDAAYCIVMVATYAQATAVLLDGPDAAVPALPQNAVLMLCSTVACGAVQELERRLAEAGRGDVLLVDCPVSGGSVRAAKGTLSIMAGGSAAAIDGARFLLQELSDASKLYIVEGGIGMGSNMKTAHQVLAAAHILAGPEALGFAANLGLDLDATSKLVQEGEARSFMFGDRMQRILTSAKGEADVKVASAISIITKDAGIITGEARRIEFPAMMTSIAEQVFFDAFSRGWAGDDDGTLIRLYTEGRGAAYAQVPPSAATDEEKTAMVVNLLKGIHLAAAAEALSFAKKAGLELSQVLELCVSAAGGSATLESVGPEIVKILNGQPPAEDIGGLLHTVEGLRAVTAEAQRLKMPLWLGNQALTVTQLVLQHAPDKTKGPRSSAVRVFMSGP